MKEIKGVLTIEKGRWDRVTNSFVDRTYETKDVTLKMAMEERGGKKILRFINGPTGHESYYVEDILDNPVRTETMCICGGTINRWPRCDVPFMEVLDFIKEERDDSERSIRPRSGEVR